MTLNNLTRNVRLWLLASVLTGTTYQASASPIEYIGDRYIVNVPELDLRGDESLLDILMMCPDVITLDGKTPLGGDPLSNLYGKYVIRFDNVEYGLDYNTLLHNLKAREIEKVQVCLHSEVMKGTGSQKKVIDIHLRKDVGEVKGLKDTYYTEGDNRRGASGEKISGRQGFFGDTYGGAESITSVRYHSDNLRILSHLEGNMQRSTFDGNMQRSAFDGNAANEAVGGSRIQHRCHEGAKVNLIWDITPNDNLEVTATQTYTRKRLSGDPASYERFYNVELDYIRTLGKNGASMLFTIATDHTSDYGKAGEPANDNGKTSEPTSSNGKTSTEGSKLDWNDYRNHCTYPYTILEFSFPVFLQNLWVTAGFEGGLSYERDCIAKHTNHSNYKDFYAQADLKLGKWGFMVGDRYRLENSTPHNAYTLSSYCHITPHRTLQATFGQQFYNAVWGDEEQNPVYVAELKHSYIKKKWMLSTMIRYISQDLNIGRVKTFNFGNTLFWHIGNLRLTAGISSYKEETTLKDEMVEVKISQFFVFKLAPQLSLPNDWRITTTLLWSTRREKESPSYAPANLYAEAAIYKTIGRHWLLEARYHDIASQHLGNRAATFGCTYYF